MGGMHTAKWPLTFPFGAPSPSPGRVRVGRGWAGRQAIEGLELLGSSGLALPQAHYRAVHHWVKNDCRRDSNKYAAVIVDVIALMKRNQPGREQPLLAVAPGGWMALSTACSPPPQENSGLNIGEKERGCQHLTPFS